jgi:hypothetical protein
MPGGNTDPLDTHAPAAMTDIALPAFRVEDQAKDCDGCEQGAHVWLAARVSVDSTLLESGAAADHEQRGTIRGNDRAYSLETRLLVAPDRARVVRRRIGLYFRHLGIAEKSLEECSDQRGAHSSTEKRLLSNELVDAPHPRICFVWPPPSARVERDVGLNEANRLTIEEGNEATDLWRSVLGLQKLFAEVIDRVRSAEPRRHVRTGTPACQKWKIRLTKEPELD